MPGTWLQSQYITASQKKQKKSLTPIGTNSVEIFGQHNIRLEAHILFFLRCLAILCPGELPACGLPYRQGVSGATRGNPYMRRKNEHDLRKTAATTLYTPISFHAAQLLLSHAHFLTFPFFESPRNLLTWSSLMPYNMLTSLYGSIRSITNALGFYLGH